MTFEAPAKVNLVLRVLGKRADGFHAIETLMAPVTLADRISLDRCGSAITLECSEPGVPCDARNLAWRAAELFLRHTGASEGVRIRLEKMIPHGAGLGGGSSDAARVLVAMNQLFGTGLPVDRLENLAAQLGSDIPFFVRCSTAWCRGRGEIIEPVAGIPSFALLLVKPPFPVPTGWAYSAWAAQDGSVPESFVCSGLTFANDLERPVFAKYLVLPAMKTWLRQQPGVSGVMMSGSGSTLFAILDGEAVGLEDRLRAEFGTSLWTVRCRTLES